MRNRAFKWLSHACRIVLGVTFIFSGFVKTVDPWGTAIKIQEYLSIYGLESLSGLRFGFSIWLCGAELMMGLMLLFKVRIRLISIFALASMIFFTVLTFLSATWLPVEDCGCFGDAVKLTPWETFAKNLVLLPLSVVVWWRYRRDRIFAFSKAEVGCTVLFFSMAKETKSTVHPTSTFAFSTAEVGCTVLFFSLAMGLGIYCYAHLPLIDFRPFKVGVNIYEAMNAYSADPGPQAGKTVLIYRDRQTGRLHEFSLDDTEWQDAGRWEWVDTRTEELDEPKVDPTLSEFSLRDAEGDATESLLTRPGRVYMLCVTDSEGLDAPCERRFRGVVERAAAEGALAVCLTPERLRGVTYRSFAGSAAVRCYNIDATTLKTMLRAFNGMVVLDDGTIVEKRNCRDIR